MEGEGGAFEFGLPLPTKKDIFNKKRNSRTKSAISRYTQRSEDSGDLGDDFAEVLPALPGENYSSHKLVEPVSRLEKSPSLEAQSPIDLFTSQKIDQSLKISQSPLRIKEILGIQESLQMVQ